MSKFKQFTTKAVAIFMVAAVLTVTPLVADTCTCTEYDPQPTCAQRHDFKHPPEDD